MRALWITQIVFKSFLEKVQPRDIIAFVVISFGFYLLLKGIDTVVGGAVIAVTTYYFVRSTPRDKSKTDDSNAGNVGV